MKKEEEVFHFNIYAYYLPPNRGTSIMKAILCKHCTACKLQCVNTYYGKYQYIAICIIDVIGLIDDFDRFDFFLRLAICQVVIFFFHVAKILICYFIPVSA